MVAAKEHQGREREGRWLDDVAEVKKRTFRISAKMATGCMYFMCQGLRKLVMYLIRLPQYLLGEVVESIGTF